MVCSKCQKKLKSTELATPGVKSKNDMYYGSPSTTLGGGSKGKSTLGATGVGKVCQDLFWNGCSYFDCLCLSIWQFWWSLADKCRINCLALKRRIHMLPMLLHVSLAKRKPSRGRSSARSVLIRGMVCSHGFLWLLLRKFSSTDTGILLACPMCGKNLAGKTAKDQPVVQGQKFNLKWC